MVRPSSPPPLPRSRPLASLADVLEPLEGEDDLPTRVGPVRSGTADMAFADTVVANDLPDDVAPLSAPALVKEPGTQVTPLSFPLGVRAANEPLWVTVRSLPRRLRRDARVAVQEILQVWRDTSRLGSFTPPATIFGLHPPAFVLAPLARIAFAIARVRALLSAWEWRASDVLRACALGIVVCALAAFAGVTALSQAAASETEPSDELREPHAVVPQHTALAHTLRRKVGR